MHTLEIPHLKKQLDFPSEIDEMNTRQYLFYLEQVLQYVSGNISLDQFRSRLVLNLLNVEMSFRFPFLKADKKLECEANLVRLSELMNSFIEEYQKDGHPVKAFKLTSVRNFVPRILSWHGPGDCFENITYCEYRTARRYFIDFAENSREEDLNHLVAVLYRPAKSFLRFRKRSSSFDGECRIPFTSKSNPLLLEKRANSLSAVPYHIRYAVFLYFSGCEQFLKNGKPVIDGATLDLSVLYDSSQGDSPKSDVGMVGLLYSMAESGVFGTIEQTDNTMLWDILIRLYQVVMQMKQLEEKQKKYDTRI